MRLVATLMPLHVLCHSLPSKCLLNSGNERRKNRLSNRCGESPDAVLIWEDCLYLFMVFVISTIYFNLSMTLGCGSLAENLVKMGPPFPTDATKLGTSQLEATKKALELQSTSGGRTSVSIDAVQHVRRMRGGSQSHLMRCSDGHYYVVKFRNNPQHLRILANEMFATRLAEAAGLPVPATALIDVDECLINHTADLHVQLAQDTVPCQSGLQFGSRYVVDPIAGQVFDYLPLDMIGRVRNLQTFAGMLVFDKWTGNTDGRQAAFWRMNRERKYTTAFIDQGFCFNGAEWTFPDHPLRGTYPRNEVYAGVRDWESFEPWLTRVETMEKDVVWTLAEDIPPEWFGGLWDELENLVGKLLERCGMIRDLIEAFRLSPREPFPAWGALPKKGPLGVKWEKRKIS
jgi:hypothetical protein